MNNKGVTLIEAIVVMGLIGIIAVSFVQLNVSFSRSVSSESLSVRANAVAVETLEAVRALRDKNWNNLNGLNANTPYYLSFSEQDKDWSIENSDPGKVENIFSRSFFVFPVSRDVSTGEIFFSGGAVDDNILKVESVVSWNDRGKNKEIKLTTYLTNF